MRLSKLCAFLLAFVFSWAAGVSAQPIPDEGLAQIQAFMADKDHWTPTEQKLQSTLLYAARIKAQGSMGPGLPAVNAGMNAYMASNAASDSTVNVTVRGDISDDLLSALSAAAGADIRSYPQFNETVPLRLFAGRVNVMVAAVAVPIPPLLGSPDDEEQNLCGRQSSRLRPRCRTRYVGFCRRAA